MANDGISMRNTPRAASPASNIDVGQLIGKNQTVNGLLGSAGEGGFQQMLASQVKRDPATTTADSTRKEAVTNDKTSRSGGNSSPHANSPTKNTATRKNDRVGDKPNHDTRAAEARVDPRKDDARPVTEKTGKSAAKDESTVASNARPSKAKQADKSEKAQTNAESTVTSANDASVPTVESAATPQVTEPTETTNAEPVVTVDGQPMAVVAVAAQNVDVALGTMEIDASATAAEDGSFVEGRSDAAKTVSTRIDIEGAPSVLTESVVPEGVSNSNVDAAQWVAVKNGSTTGTVASAEALVSELAEGMKMPLTESVSADNAGSNSTSSTSSTSSASTDSVSTNSISAPPLSADNAGDEATDADPALKDLITAMIKSKEQSASTSAATSTVSASAPPVSNADAPVNITAPVGQNNVPVLSTPETSSAEQALAAVTQELRTPERKAAWVAREQASAAQINAASVIPQENAPEQQAVTDITFSADQTTLEESSIDEGLVEECLVEEGSVEESSEPVSTLPEADEDVFEALTNTDDALESNELDAEVSTELRSQTVEANKTTPTNRSFAPPLTEDAIPTHEVAETAEATDSWSILDAVTEVAPEETPGVEAKVQVQAQNEQQMALVRNELRNLERLVDGGLQSVAARSAPRKEDKASDIKPAALSRALESLGTGVKTAELRGSTQVTNTPVAFGRQGFAEQMAEKIMLMTTQKVQVADIRLDPKEMGTIEVKIRVHQDQASVVFSSANPQVRDALETSIPRLREMFADAGVGLGSVNVNDRGASAGGNNEQSQGRGEGAGLSGPDDVTEERSGLAPRQTNGLVDYYA